MADDCQDQGNESQRVVVEDRQMNGASVSSASIAIRKSTNRGYPLASQHELDGGPTSARAPS